MLSKKLIEFMSSMSQKTDAPQTSTGFVKKMLTRTPPSPTASSAIRNWPPNLAAAESAYLSSTSPSRTARKAPSTRNPSCGSVELMPAR